MGGVNDELLFKFVKNKISSRIIQATKKLRSFVKTVKRKFQIMEEKKWAYEIVNGKAIIPQGTKKIVPNAFYDCEELRSVEIPEGVTHICENAFRCCTNLHKVTLPESLEYIDDRAFAHCPALGELTIGDRIKEISHGAFYRSTIDGITIYKEEPTEEMIYALVCPTKIKRKVIVPDIAKYFKVIDNFSRSHKDVADCNKEALRNFMEDCSGVTYDMLKEEEEKREEERKEQERKEVEKKEKKNNRKMLFVAIVLLLLAWIMALMAR